MYAESPSFATPGVIKKPQPTHERHLSRGVGRGATAQTSYRCCRCVRKVGMFGERLGSSRVFWPPLLLSLLRFNMGRALKGARLHFVLHTGSVSDSVALVLKRPVISPRERAATVKRAIA